MKGFRSAMCMGFVGEIGTWRCFGKHGYNLYLVKCDSGTPNAEPLVPVEIVCSRDLIKSVRQRQGMLEYEMWK
eukprot:5294917-Pyramimonas_sp.AAC.1